VDPIGLHPPLYQLKKKEEKIHQKMKNERIENEGTDNNGDENGKNNKTFQQRLKGMTFNQ
jgi:hypothetical protein